MQGVRPRGNCQPPRGRGRLLDVHDLSDQGFNDRWANRPIPPPPKTPCADPLEMPFPKLKTKNASGHMTLDEELLRAIVSIFTVKAVASLPLSDIFDKLKRDHDHLLYLLYHDSDYLWAYIRCYPEQFAVDRDPRIPDHVWYISKCKVVAKSDRRRYERELAAGNLRLDPTIGHGDDLDGLVCDFQLEETSITWIWAIFKQLKTKLLMNAQVHVTQLPMKFVRTTLEKA